MSPRGLITMGRFQSSSSLNSEDSILLFTVPPSKGKPPVCTEYFSIFLEMISFFNCYKKSVWSKKTLSQLFQQGGQAGTKEKQNFTKSFILLFFFFLATLVDKAME